MGRAMGSAVEATGRPAIPLKKMESRLENRD
jgi:hypothetical protein